MVAVVSGIDVATAPGGRAMTTARLPTVRVEYPAVAAPLVAVIHEATQLLSDAGLVHMVHRGEPADVLHTVGDITRCPDRPTGRWVHTVDRVPLRRHEFAATRRWVRSERRRAAQCGVWLTHGRTAGRLVVEAALAPGERVHCMPVLSPWRFRSAAMADSRTAVRRALNVAPGVRLVVGVDSNRLAPPVGDWVTALTCLGRTDVQVLRLTADGVAEGQPPTGMTLAGLLAAADLFVATGDDLAACSPGVSALAIGLPVVAVTTDSVAELVAPGRTGSVVAPRCDSIVAAVATHLDAAPCLGRAATALPDRPAAQQVARGLLRAYQQALAAPPGPTKVRWAR
jgi:Glycosyl transferases group 1